MMLAGGYWTGPKLMILPPKNATYVSERNILLCIKTVAAHLTRDQKFIIHVDIEHRAYWRK